MCTILCVGPACGVGVVQFRDSWRTVVPESGRERREVRKKEQEGEEKERAGPTLPECVVVLVGWFEVGTTERERIALQAVRCFSNAADGTT